jgi:signal transduction histidine kinase
MKQQIIGLSQRYVKALRNHLKQTPRASTQAALRLGRQAVTIGLETLELARIHEQAIATLDLSNRGNGHIKRAESFFTEAITPIMETHNAARQSQIDLNRMSDTVRCRTAELATANHQLQRDIVRRMSMEASLKKSGAHYTKLLDESLQLQEGLRQLTHQVLAAQENERANISRELRDEISQTLLGINVRLLTLKQEARSNTKGLKDEIASTQRLVAESARSVRGVTHKFKRA